MNTATISYIEHELEHITTVLASAEPWAMQYSKAPEQHKKLIQLEAKMERIMRDYLRGLKNERIHKYVNWQHYYAIMMSKKAAAKKPEFDVSVIVSEDDFTVGEQSLLVQALYDPLVLGATIGAQAGEEIYKTPLGINQSSDAIQKFALEHSTSLAKDLTGTTLDQIRNSLSTSIGLHETTEEATQRLVDLVGDYSRAGTIARTESVRSYSEGLLTFGNQSGATGKRWETSPSACVICAPMDGQEVGIDEQFDSGDDSPPAHPNCRCSMYLSYPVGNDTEADTGE